MGEDYQHPQFEGRAQRPTARVFLTEADAQRAADIGVARQMVVRGWSRNIWNARGSLFDEQWGTNIVGAHGEVALAKWMDIDFNPTIGNTSDRYDVGPYQARATTDIHGGLRFRPRDEKKGHLNDAFVMAVLRSPYVYLRGWLYGYEIRQDKWFKSPNNYPYWSAPQSALRDILDLPNLDSSCGPEWHRTYDALMEKRKAGSIAEAGSDA